MPIEMVDEDLLLATEGIQHAIAVSSTDSALDHLGKRQVLRYCSRPGLGGS
jgi:hypothetical protein